MDKYCKKVCGVKEPPKGKVLKFNWDSSKISIMGGDKTIFVFTNNDDKLSKIHYIAVKPGATSQINYRNTYSFIARLNEICSEEDDPVVVCGLDMVEKKASNKHPGTYMRADFYKSSNNYEVKMYNTFSISKNSNKQLETRPFFNQKIDFVMDIKRHRTTIHNATDKVPLFLWHEDDGSYFESFNWLSAVCGPRCAVCGPPTVEVAARKILGGYPDCGREEI